MASIYWVVRQGALSQNPTTTFENVFKKNKYWVKKRESPTENGSKVVD